MCTEYATNTICINTKINFIGANSFGSATTIKVMKLQIKAIVNDLFKLSIFIVFYLFT